MYHIFAHTPILKRLMADGGESKPRFGTVNFKDISSHPTQRMDAAYHLGKKEGKNAYKKNPDGTLELDDKSGKIMLTKEDAEEYNRLHKEKKEAQKKLDDFIYYKNL